MILTANSLKEKALELRLNNLFNKFQDAIKEEPLSIGIHDEYLSHAEVGVLTSLGYRLQRQHKTKNFYNIYWSVSV